MHTDPTVTFGQSTESAAPILAAADYLCRHDDFLILCHQKPDGDTIGSAYALREALLQMGKRAQVACSDPFTPRYSFITGGEHEPRRNFTPKGYITVDVADTSLLGDKLEHLAANIDLAIDHHPSFTNFGRLNACYPHAAAAGEIVCHLIRALPVRFTESIGIALYTAIATDTGCFRYANTSPSALRMAADLQAAGVDIYALNYRLFMLRSKTRMQLEARIVETAHFYHDNRIAVAVVPLSIHDELRVTEDDLDDLGTLMRCIEGVEVGVLLRETPSGSYRVSLRSSDKVNSSEIARTFGGGGHRRAAGCLMYGPAEAAEARLVDEILRAFDPA
ncbi:MAG: bifunctional oligoribonuclease/PAP phosphatase NrnA [Clostridiales bacterium]|nr:bifunctional oligoribonuclease/PAP phosphatase NrnA [Clostridiales bacterium]